jgi:CheY-like chemotaxis protein
MIEQTRILLAEDNPLDVELTMSVLQENRIANEIDVVSNGADALDYLYERGQFAGRPGGKPTLVLVDLKMPKVDGIEVVRLAKADANLRTIPFVMLTSSREERDLIRSYDCGVNSYVIKPVDFNAFVEAIRTLGVYWTVHNQPHPTQGI